MQLRRQVTLKVIVTDKFKEETIKELEETIEQVEQGRNQIEFRSRILLSDLQRQDLNQAAEFRRRVEAEKQRMEDAKTHLSEQLEEIRAAEVGTELERGNLEGFVDIQVGDNLQARLSQAEIVLKDDVVVEIREGQPAAS